MTKTSKTTSKTKGFENLKDPESYLCRLAWILAQPVGAQDLWR
jgi:hypothetical protein